MTQENYMDPKVDFSYTFSPPHRLTLALPDSGDKTLFDAEPGKLALSWTYEDLTKIPVGAYMVPPTIWHISVVPEIDGQPFSESTWTRAEGWLPVLVNSYDDARGSVRLEATGGKTAAIVHVRISNTDDKPHRFSLRCETANQWGRGFNPAWVELDGPDVLCAGWRDRGDRILMMGVGADEYPVSNSHVLCPSWSLEAGETREGWLIRPYRATAVDLNSLRTHDWESEMGEARNVWTKLVGRACPMQLTDPDVENAFRACFADLFIMREPVERGYIAGIPGTEKYRFSNQAEPGIACIAMDQFGLHDEAERGFRVFLEPAEPGQRPDMRDSTELFWAFAGFRAWVAIEHYRLTQDRDYLKKVYPGLATTSKWQEEQRARTRVMVEGERPDTYGLMPRGVGDCGLMDDDDYFGVFLPHNIWAVFADRCSIEVAEILGRESDLPELRKIHDTAQEDLLTALDRGAIVEDKYRWIPGVSGKTSGSCWGGLNALYPCRILPPDHDLISGTIRHMEAHLSPGGLPLNLGWMPDGLWVAIALDNLAQAYLERGDGDTAVAYLYATLNHGTPFFTWCEERGKEPNATKIAGDPQHLWTPVSVVRFIRDALVMEDGDGLHLARGTARHWLASGKPMGIVHAPTHFGPVTFEMQYDEASAVVKGKVVFQEQSSAEWAVMHIRLPGSLRAVAVDSASGAALLPDGSGIQWTSPRGINYFEVSIQSME